MAGAEAEASIKRWRTAIAPFVSDPGSAAVFTDLDGTLAPIVARPDLVAVPERTRHALEEIAASYAFCAVITGRRPEDAREIVGIDGIGYAGNHGFELLEPGDAKPKLNPALLGHLEDAHDFVDGDVDLPALERVGVRFEDKGPIVAFHWRGVEDEGSAERAVDELAIGARSRSLVTHLGRKVLELRPAVRIDKGVAIEGLLDGCAVRRALYAGDDRTDIDGFHALGRMKEAGRLEAIVRVAVRSPEGPDELIEAADVTVEGTDELADLFEALTG